MKEKNTELEKLKLKLRNRESRAEFLVNELERANLLKENREKIIEKLKLKIEKIDRVSKEFSDTLCEHNKSKLNFFKAKKLTTKLVSHSLDLTSVCEADFFSDISYHDIPTKILLKSEQYIENSDTPRPPTNHTFENLGRGAKELTLDMPATEWDRVQDEVFQQEGRHFMQYCFGGKLRLLPRKTMNKEIARTSRFLFALRDKVSKRKCIVVGNGPSLNKHDFSIMRGNFMIGSNYIFLNQGRMGYLPDIITATNFLVVEQRLEEFLAVPVPKIFPFYMYPFVGEQENVFYANIHHFPEFSDDVTLWSTTRHTVTYFNLQLAYFLGFEETFLIGVDNSYKQKEKIEGRIINQKEDDPNHFSPEYFKGLDWQSADSDAMVSVYETAKQYFEDSGKTIKNAGIGGALETFERVDYKSSTKDLRKKFNIKPLLKFATRSDKETTVIVSINPDMSDYFGHYYRLDLKLLEFTQQHNDQFVSLAHKNVARDLNGKFPRIVPCFSEKSFEVGLRNLNDSNNEKVFEDELLYGIRQTLEYFPDCKNYEFFMYCGSYPHLKAIRDILDKLSIDKIRIRFHLHIFYPAFEQAFDRNSETYRTKLLSKISSHDNLLLYAGTQQYLAVLNNTPNHSKFSLRYLPCPSTTFSDIELPRYQSISRKAKIDSSICFPGNLRPEKGLNITLDSLLAINNNPYFDDLEIFVRSSKKIESIDLVDLYRCALADRINWLEGDLTDSNFKRLIANSGIIVIPYSNEAFSLRPSGIFSDSIVMQKPIMAATGTFMANIIETYGNGAVFDPNIIDSFIDGLKDIMNNPDRILLACELAGKKWESVNSWEIFYKNITN